MSEPAPAWVGWQADAHHRGGHVPIREHGGPDSGRQRGGQRASRYDLQEVQTHHLHKQRLPHDVPQVADARSDVFEQGFKFHGIPLAPRGGVEPRRPPHQSLHAGLQSPHGRLDHLIEGGQLFFQVELAGAGNGVGTAAVARFQGADPPALFQARDRSIEGAGAQAYAGKALDILHHGVAVLFAIGEAGKNE